MTLANDNYDPLLVDEERLKELHRETKDIGWYDKETHDQQPHYLAALRIYWGKQHQALVAIVAGDTPHDLAANDD
jgi:hypothetical protein